MKRVLACLLVLVVALPAAAKSPYVTAQSLDLLPYVPPPPTADSARAKAEMDEVLALQASRSPERTAQAAADAVENVYVLFQPLLGPGFNAAALPKTDLLFTRVRDSEGATLDPVKDVYKRPRPFQANSAVKPAIPLSMSGSYPSGHATAGTLMGIVMAELLPEKRVAIWARIDDYAESRIIGGVHYRSDLEAGRSAGAAIAAYMWANPSFRADFAAASNELRASLGLPKLEVAKKVEDK